jgi:hypothetical protein
MSETIMVAGPYVGEFGYELFKWQGYVRTQAKLYDRTIISSRPGHGLLYSDFSDTFISYISPINPCAGIANAPGVDFFELASKVFRGIAYNRVIVPFKLEKDTPQEYVAYGRKGNYTEYDMVVHARQICVHPGDMRETDKSLKESRNWAFTNWENMLKRLSLKNLKICCIGHTDAAQYLPGTDDKRGIDLNELSDLLANAKVIVGPSSGPMHFATLCRCPQVVWGTSNLGDRYCREWNPFYTPVTFIPVDVRWDPTPEQVADLTAAVLNA